MEARYWKAIVRYGHVGRKKEISVSRFIQTQLDTTLIDAYNIFAEMPGVKARGVMYIQEVDKLNYEAGKTSEKSNLFLDCLMTHNCYSINHFRKGA